jgi:hypothetical protein
MQGWHAGCARARVCASIASSAKLRVASHGAVARSHTGQNTKYWLVLKQITRAAPCFCVCARVGMSLATSKKQEASPLQNLWQKCSKRQLQAASCKLQAGPGPQREPGRQKPGSRQPGSPTHSNSGATTTAATHGGAFHATPTAHGPRTTHTHFFFRAMHFTFQRRALLSKLLRLGPGKERNAQPCCCDSTLTTQVERPEAAKKWREVAVLIDE